LGAFHKYELPGEDLILKGLEDLKAGHKTIESLLICIGAPRLKRLGLQFTPLELDDFPEMHLYRLLASEDSDNAHARNNAYVQRLIKFESALEKMGGIPPL